MSKSGRFSPMYSECEIVSLPNATIRCSRFTTSGAIRDLIFHSSLVGRLLRSMRISLGWVVGYRATSYHFALNLRRGRLRLSSRAQRVNLDHRANAGGTHLLHISEGVKLREGGGNMHIDWRWKCELPPPLAPPSEELAARARILRRAQFP